MLRIGSALILFILFASTARAQTLARIQVDAVTEVSVERPVTIDLDAITYAADSVLALVEVWGDERRTVPFQIRAGAPRTMHWIHASAGTGVYEVVQRTGVPAQSAGIDADRADGQLILRSDGRPLLTYQHTLMPPPSGIDSAYARSGFIHPLRTPSGFALTWIQPPDHYHHYGLWNPWTQVEYRGRIVDFWNLDKREGTVRFAGFGSISEGPVFGEFEVVHEHVVFSDEGEEVALNELQRVRVHRVSDSGYYVMDVAIVLSCATAHPVRLLEYRYGGFGWRGPRRWTHENSRMRSSEGRTRVDADGTRARWLLVQGEADRGEAGMLLMSHPSNYNHPEPLRVWPPDAHEEGDVFVNISPTKNTDWLLEPGRRYALRYRLVVFDGDFSPEAAEAHWQAFVTSPPPVE